MKQLAIKFTLEDDDYYLVVLRCGHASRYHRSVVEVRHATRKWFTCPRCAEIRRLQRNFGFSK